MRRTALALPLAALLAALVAASPQAPKADEPASKPAPAANRDDLAKTPPGFVRFRVQEIERGLKVCYAVVTADVNDDGKPDVVVVDTNQVVWYENPSWKRRIIVGPGQTKTDNVCISPADIDGDGKVDFAIGADWGPIARQNPSGTMQWVKRGATLDEPWTVYPIGDLPSVHRMRFLDLDGTGKKRLVVAPLMGRESTYRLNWTDGRPVRIAAYAIPSDPVRGPWVPEVLDESLHVVHNFSAVPASLGRQGLDLLAASYEGVSLIAPDQRGVWSAKRICEGDQGNPQGSRGASEVKAGKLKGGQRYIATIEPWHGNRVVVYTPPDNPKNFWVRHTVDSRLRWGHALWCADMNGDGDEDLIVGVRDNPKPTDSFNDRSGVRLYRCTDGVGARWDERLMIDPDGVTVEDLTVADLDADGRLDIVAVGRMVGNVRIYWNIGR